jgi:hypothetical protein
MRQPCWVPDPLSPRHVACWITSVLRSGQSDDFLREVVRFRRAWASTPCRPWPWSTIRVTRSEFVSIDNAPDGFAGPPAPRWPTSHRDPVMQHCKPAHGAHRLGPGHLPARGWVDLWEEQARFGYHTGIAMALHLPEGRHFMPRRRP